jgi:dUTPase
MIVTPHSVAHMVQVDSLPGSHRGEGGFGSTGTTDTAGETP